MCTSFVVIRAITDDDASIRLHSDAFLRGLHDRDGFSSSLISPDSRVPIPEDSCILIHFNDEPACTRARWLAGTRTDLTIACLGSDIYDFNKYVRLHDFVDLYIMPTDLHRRILAAQVYKPVFAVPECIDPITGWRSSTRFEFPIKSSRRLLWFGYPESFLKSMVSLLPILQGNLSKGTVTSVSLITGNELCSYNIGIPIIPYSNSTFRFAATGFDYCILSHFPLDLSLNSYIKSPNKLVTALMAGLIPIASDTPNYRVLLEEFGLNRFLFDSPAALNQIFDNLDPENDSRAISRSGIMEAIQERFSDSGVAATLVRVVQDLTDRRKRGEQIDGKFGRPCTLDAIPPQTYFRHHLSDFFPSLLRAAKSRLGGTQGIGAHRRGAPDRNSPFS
jgi:hypothetical protein